MNIIQGGEIFSFNYTTYDQNSSLFVAFNVYDVTTGTAVFLSQVPGQYSGFGSYMGTYMAVSAKTYLVVGVVYTDGTYLTPDITRSPTADLFQAAQLSITDLAFAYASYDQSATLNVQATIYNVTSGSPIFDSQAAMVLVGFGVYFGAFTGVVGDTYNVLGIVYTSNTFVTPDLTRAPSSDQFSCITLPVALVVAGQAELSNNSSSFNSSLTPPIHITQGDDALLYLVAEDEAKNPIDLTSATFTTFINGPNGVVQSFPNSQHVANADQNDFTGQFILTLSNADTASLGLGNHQEILTQITIGAGSVFFRGPNLLQVYPPVPF